MIDRLEIRAALSRLQERANDDAFLIIEEMRTKKFLQFAGGKDQPLVFDLPPQTLAPEELARAKEALSRFGVALNEDGFSKELGKDAAKASELAWVVLTEVYAFSEPLDLRLEEN